MGRAERRLGDRISPTEICRRKESRRSIRRPLTWGQLNGNMSTSRQRQQKQQQRQQQQQQQRRREGNGRRRPARLQRRQDRGAG